MIDLLLDVTAVVTSVLPNLNRLTSFTSVYRFIGVLQQESGKGPRIANGAAYCVPGLTSHTFNHRELVGRYFHVMATLIPRAGRCFGSGHHRLGGCSPGYGLSASGNFGLLTEIKEYSYRLRAVYRHTDYEPQDRT